MQQWFNRRKNAWVLISFSLIAVMFYLPLMGNAFLSDDYDSLYRILIEKRVIYRPFFRPLTDILFYANYLISGLNPVSYYVVNLVIHILCAFMAYKIALKIPLYGEERQWWFAVVAGLLFLVYPFHNEAVAWLTGRIVSAACLCGLLAIYWSMQAPGSWKYFWWGAAAFLVGLSGYESIILLFLIIPFFNQLSGASVNKRIKVFGAWTGIAIFYLVARFFISGTVTTTYGSRIFSFDSLSSFAGRYGKAFSRLLLPPGGTATIMIGMAAGAALLIVALHLLLFNKIRRNRLYVKVYLAIVVSLIISMLLPGAFGVSTKSSDGDRLLYFPSFFLCLLISYFLFTLVKRRALLASAAAVLLIFSGYFLWESNNRWNAASAAADDILNAARKGGSNARVLVNLPEDIGGAFVFRNGFKKALVINRIDTGKVTVINYLDWPSYCKAPRKIIPLVSNDSILIYPGVTIYRGEDTMNIINLATGNRLTANKSSLIYYWDKTGMVRLRGW